MTKPGFMYLDNGTKRRVFFIERRGKDISFERWRLTLFYSPNFAATALFPNEAEYNRFLEANEPRCFTDFEDFCRESDQETQTTARTFRCPDCKCLALESEGCRYCHPNQEANDQETQVDRELKTGAAGLDSAAPPQLTLL